MGQEYLRFVIIVTKLLRGGFRRWVQFANKHAYTDRLYLPSCHNDLSF